MRASRSRCFECDVQEFGGGFAVFKPFCDDAQRQSLDLSYRFVTIVAVAHHAWESANFGEPPASILTFEFDRECHNANVAL